MAQQTITALFDNREYANNAALMLRQAGIADTAVTVSPESATSSDVAAGTPATGFWASLEDLFGGTHDHQTYAEGVRRGDTMITAHVDDRQVDDVIAILEKHGSVDMNERETTWRGEGWTGASSLATAPLVPTPTALVGEGTTALATSSSVADEGVIQVVDEQLSVGKRAVNRGKVRIHSYVVEKAVSEDVTLRDETISIDRRPVDRALGTADLGVDAFQDRTIEMDEMGQEAVVAKSARVVEEIGIRKNAIDRVQTVNDSVRSTKVDIEDARIARTTTPGVLGVTSGLAENMEVVGSEGQHVGIVDQVDGSTITLKKTDPTSGGQHHLIPTDWVKSVGAKVILTITAADAQRRWTAI